MTRATLGHLRESPQCEFATEIGSAVRNDSQRHRLGNLQHTAPYAAVAAAGWRSHQLSNYLLAVSVSEWRFAYIFMQRGIVHGFQALCMP